MNRQVLTTFVAALAVVVITAGSALAAPITVVIGQWTWTEDEFGFGAIFDVTNSSNLPIVTPGGDPLADPAWEPGEFEDVVVTLTTLGEPCPDEDGDCVVPIVNVGVGASENNLELVFDPWTIASATLSLLFRGELLTSTITQVFDGGVITFQYTPGTVPVPAPAGGLLVVIGLAAWSVRRRVSQVASRRVVRD